MREKNSQMIKRCRCLGMRYKSILVESQTWENGSFKLDPGIVKSLDQQMIRMARVWLDSYENIMTLEASPPIFQARNHPIPGCDLTNLHKMMSGEKSM